MATDLLEQLERLDGEAHALVDEAQDERALEAVRVRLLGRKDGRLTGILRGLGTLSAEERPAVGAAANRVKAHITELLDARAATLAGGGEARGPAFNIYLVQINDLLTHLTLHLRTCALANANDRLQELHATLRARASDLLDSWSKVAEFQLKNSARLRYQPYEGGAGPALPVSPRPATRFGPPSRRG